MKCCFIYHITLQKLNVSSFKMGFVTWLTVCTGAVDNNCLSIEIFKEAAHSAAI